MSGSETFFWTVLATLVAILIGWLAEKGWQLWHARRAAKRLPTLVSLAFDDTDQYRRTEARPHGDLTFQRTVYLLGVVNNSHDTLRGVQCFVVSVKENPGEQRRRPLQPLGTPEHAERIDVPPSTNGQPSAYFQFVEDFTEPNKESDWAWLCVPFGECALPFIGHVTVSLEGEGFVHEATFSVAKRKRAGQTPEGKYIEVRRIPLTVRRLDD